MCCVNKPSHTGRLYTEMGRKRRPTTFWKVRIRRGNRLRPPFGSGEWTAPGVKKAKRASASEPVLKGRCKRRTSIFSGIHVYTDRAVAKRIARRNSAVLLAVLCSPEDLIGANSNRGYPTAVFRQVKVTQRAWDAAMARR